MAYNAIAQADLDMASNASDSDASRSPSPKASPQHHGFEKVPLDVDNLGGNGSKLEPARAADDISVGRLVSRIRSMSSTSYDMVGDDYEAVEPKSNSPCRNPAPIDTTTAINKSYKAVDDKQPQSASSVPPPEEPPLRTPVSDHTVPLSHPTPGLQSLQGAYLGNIERLERSAERMSAGSTDIASEIRKMDLELKRRCSSSSVANSVVASNDDRHTSIRKSPTSNQPSPRSSIRSATRLPSSRLAQVSEAAGGPSQPPSSSRFYSQRFYSARGVNPEIERPSSAATNDTYQQAKVLFSDFDGVHYVPQDSVQGRERKASLTKPPLAKQSKSYRADSMVYYPAPVPTALNLPPRLSDKPPQEKRRTHRLSAALFGHRRSALGPSDRPATSREIQVSQTSPVATLDRILDDSTHAPVTTSAERPCTSAEAYGISHQETSSQDLEKQKKKRSSRSLFRFYKKTSSSSLSDPPATGHPPQPTEAEAADTHEGTALKSDVADGQEGGGEVLDHSQEDIRDYTGPPDSLMAELELRKHELKHRSRTAADPQGLRSTLLQLDAVAQKQSERRQRPVSMAWDNSNAVYNGSEGDEDVPLGILYPEKPDIPVETRPLDLMEKRQMEENEPLSKRRARLRGEQPAVQPPNLPNRPSTMYLPGSHGPADSDSENEGETLAQRIKRLRAKNRNSTTGGSDFTSEVLAEFNYIKDNDSKEGETASQDETLAETRARLRQDSKPQLSRYANVPRMRRSMGSISLMRPETAGRQSSHETALDHAPVYSQHAYHDPRMSMHQAPVGYQHPQYARYPVAANSYGYGMGRPNTIYNDAMLGMNHTGYAMPGYPNMGTPMAGVGQQERINHWRQSVI